MEIWKDIKDYEGLYQVSNLGRIKSLERTVFHSRYGKQKIKESIKKPYLTKSGYYRIQLSKKDNTKNFLIHRLIAIHFIPNPENKPQINHINSIRTDNRLENLEWCTISENLIHAYKKGYKEINPEESNFNKLSKNQVIQILYGKYKSFSNKKLALIFDVWPSTIWKIRTKKTWKNL